MFKSAGKNSNVIEFERDISNSPATLSLVVSRDHFITLNKLCLYQNDVIWRVCPWFDIQIRSLFSIKAIFHPFCSARFALISSFKIASYFFKKSPFPSRLNPFYAVIEDWVFCEEEYVGLKVQSLAKVKHWHFISCLSQHSNCLKKWTMHVLKNLGDMQLHKMA